MLELFAAYLKEVDGFSMIGNDHAFATYFIEPGKHVYIRDLFVHPDFRKSGIASELADEICRRAKEQGCTQLQGTVSDAVKDRDRSIKVLYGYGMKYHGYSPELKSLVFIKDL